MTNYKIKYSFYDGNNTYNDGVIYPDRLKAKLIRSTNSGLSFKILNIAESIFIDEKYQLFSNGYLYITYCDTGVIHIEINLYKPNSALTPRISIDLNNVRNEQLVKSIMETLNDEYCRTDYFDSFENTFTTKAIRNGNIFHHLQTV